MSALRHLRIHPGDVVPGLRHFRNGQYRAGCVYLALFLLSIAVLAGNAGKIVNGIASLLLTAWLLIVEPEAAKIVFSLEVLEFWIAAVYAVVLPFLIAGISAWSASSAAGERDGEGMSTWEISYQRFRNDPVARGGTLFLFVLYNIAILAPLVTPYNPNTFQDGLTTQFRPPFTRLTALVLREPRIHTVPFAPERAKGTHGDLLKSLVRINTALVEDPTRRLIFVDAFHVEGSNVVATQRTELLRVPIAQLVSTDPKEFATTRLFVLGTDSYGRDILSRMVFGSRISLSIGCIAVFLSITLGTFIGLTAGYFGRFIDSISMRTVDILLAFPSLFLILITVSLFDTMTVPRIFLVVLVLGFTSWMGVARLVRGEVLALKGQEFILAAHAAGLSHFRIIFRHILPNVMTPVIVNATLRIGGMILVEAALSFLNLGVQPPTASWGNIIYEGKDYLAAAWWISTFPGLAIVATVVCFNLIGDGLRDAFDPRLRRM
ncbi:MAG: ABC transporter permease [Bacteroidota bacterium]|nr:ABC transporter permease [Bacteroidota bacterium]